MEDKQQKYIIDIEKEEKERKSQLEKVLTKEEEDDIIKEKQIEEVTNNNEEVEKLNNMPNKEQQHIIEINTGEKEKSKELAEEIITNKIKGAKEEEEEEEEEEEKEKEKEKEKEYNNHLVEVEIEIDKNYEREEEEEKRESTQEGVIKKKKVNTIVKYILIVIGSICFILGTIGIVLPLLPTVPFYLLTLLCFAKSSERLNQRFVNSKFYKNNMEDFMNGKGMTVKAKIKAFTVITILMSIGFILMKKVFIGRIILATVWVFHIILFSFIIKTRKEDKTKKKDSNQTLNNENQKIDEDKEIHTENNTNKNLISNNNETLYTDLSNNKNDTLSVNQKNNYDQEINFIDINQKTNNNEALNNKKGSNDNKNNILFDNRKMNLFIDTENNVNLDITDSVKKELQ